MNARQADLVLPRQGIVGRIAKHPALMHYHRLVFMVAFINLTVLSFGANDGNWWAGDGIALGAIANLVLVNFSIAVLIRQQYIVNLLFWIVTRAPTSWPLAVRWHLGKVYHFGGLHSGCAVAATAWFAVFVASLTYHLAKGLPGVSTTMVALTFALLIVLVLIVAMAMPRFRARSHNSFEMMHRFGGWSALLLFWAQAMVFVNDQRGSQTFGKALVSSGAFWMLIVMTISIALPWLRLRRVRVKVVRPSSHAVVARFKYTTPFAGSSTAISRNPLLEWHSFANIPSPGRKGFRLIISRAGDWTGSFIDDMPSHVWVKGITTAGVANIETLFKRVVYVATGSGIGPVMPHLLAKKVPIQLIWSTRNPRKTYGDKLVNKILEVCPDALIWDTEERGKPDLVKLAYGACRSFNAEAVICIANQKLTNEVVYGMESRGIPGYGAIWDS
jgi:hypothetical protein